jgi:hypothetical protein
MQSPPEDLDLRQDVPEFVVQNILAHVLGLLP